MKTFLYCAAVCCVFISIITINSCSKKSDSGSGGSNNNNNTDPPKSTPIGTPVGNATSQIIGPSGGTVTTADGIIKLVFPANAVSANTTITIQPISNNCPGGNMLAYRFGPNGTKFNQPVTLQIHYPDSILYSGIPELMGVAVQDSSGFWKRTTNFSNDTTHRIISATIKHFTDYSMMELIKIQPADTSVALDGQVTLVLTAYDSEDPDAANTADDFAADIKASHTPIVWAVNGVDNGNSQVGTINNAPVAKQTAIYKAPSKVPVTDPVTVTATASNLNIKYNGHTYNKVIAYAHINVYLGRYNVKIDFSTLDNPTLGGSYLWTDHGSFNVEIANISKVTDVANQGASYLLQSNNTTCTSILNNAPPGPINILNKNHVVVNPITSQVTVLFDSAIAPSSYIPNPQLLVTCPGQQPYTIGGEMTPCFPSAIQFFLVDSTQTMVAGQYTITVTKNK